MTRMQPPARSVETSVPNQTPPPGDSAANHDRSAADAVLDPHATIGKLFFEARSAEPTQEDPRLPFAKCDTFVATLSRHLAAVEDVVYPAARRDVDNGPSRVAQQVRLSRGLELTMRALVGTFYGDAYYPSEVRDLLWDRMSKLLTLHDDAERPVVADLDAHMSPPEKRTFMVEFAEAVESAPTRPHPYSPHSTWLSPAQHRLWAIADRAMDSMDNRIIPAVRRPQITDPDSLLTQYLSGSPQFAEE